MSVKPYSQKTETGRVLVGLSGGVHSAVTAALLKTQGYEVQGAYLELSCPTGLALSGSRCCKQSGLQAAEQVATRLGIQLHVIDAREAYEQNVLEYLAHETAQGRMPLPCVPCYRSVKIGRLLAKADELRFDFIATGHGAQLHRDPRTQQAQLLKASDPLRDQSYFLFGLTQAEIARLLLPLGNFPKSLVAKLAGDYGFPAVESDSREVCFVSTANYPTFIENRLAPALRATGVVRSHDNQVLGEHGGIHRYPIGSKVSLQLSSKEAESFVVIGTDPATHSLILGPRELLKRQDLLAFRVSWLKPVNQLMGLRCQAQLTPDSEPVDCRVTLFENETAQVHFDQASGPVIPGQAVVFYLDHELLGGGWIQR